VATVVRILKLILLLAIVALVALFAVQNYKPATVHFLAWSAEMSLALPLLAAYVLGGLTGRLVVRLFRSWRRDASAERRQHRTSAGLHGEPPHAAATSADPRAATVPATDDHPPPAARSRLPAQK
jgi:uncharacterized integral membrane protein